MIDIDDVCLLFLLTLAIDIFDGWEPVKPLGFLCFSLICIFIFLTRIPQIIHFSSEESSFFDSTLETCLEPEILFSFEAPLTLAIIGNALCAPS